MPQAHPQRDIRRPPEAAAGLLQCRENLAPLMGWTFPLEQSSPIWTAEANGVGPLPPLKVAIRLRMATSSIRAFQGQGVFTPTSAPFYRGPRLAAEEAILSGCRARQRQTDRRRKRQQPRQLREAQTPTPISQQHCKATCCKRPVHALFPFLLSMGHSSSGEEMRLSRSWQRATWPWRKG